MKVLAWLAALAALMMVSTTAKANEWGTLRPNLYFGPRLAVPESPLTGLAWFSNGNYQALDKLRHACDQHHALSGYGYTAHNARDYAKQSIRDPESNLDLHLEWVAATDTNDWTLRVSGTPLDSTKPSPVSLLFYSGFDRPAHGTPHALAAGAIDGSPSDPEGLVMPFFNGTSTTAVGDMALFVRIDPSSLVASKAWQRPRVHSIQTKPEKLWSVAEDVKQQLMARAQAVVGRIEREHGAQALQAHLPIPADLFSLSDPVNDGNNNPDDEEEERPRVENVGIVQLAFNGAFTFDIALVSGPDADAQAARALFNQFEATSQGRASDFERQLSATFPLPGTGLPPQSRKLASYVFSNLLGGIGYFHGTSIENRMPETEADTFEWEYYADPDDEDAEEQLAAWRRARAARKQVAPATSLLTGTPSRSFFPRGFFWDEGFHLELVARWDSRLAARIVESWLATQDKATGWIAREQILGDEARSRVPDQFQEQAPHIANPPTLIMGARAVVDAMVTSSSGANGLFTDPNTANTATTNGTASAADTFIAAVVPGFYKHWQWLHKSQSGIPDDFGRSIGSPHVYRWRGRTERHNFASGLDDYPRADPPSIGELHLDLTAWMAWYARELAALARRSQAPGFRTSPATERMLLDLDTAADRASAHVRDVFWEPLTSGNTGSGGFGDLAVTASEDASYVHVRKGYVSLLPWILDLVPAATHPEQHAWSLALVRDLARGGHGAQSLHRDDEVYGQGEDYWRGSVWINWQYMVLRALHRDTARRVPGAKDLYDSVRADVLKTVADGYANTGFVHENYHGETGAPRGSHPFTGWTSLVLLIMSEQY